MLCVAYIQTEVLFTEFAHTSIELLCMSALGKWAYYDNASWLEAGKISSAGKMIVWVLISMTWLRATKEMAIIGRILLIEI